MQSKNQTDLENEKQDILKKIEATVKSQKQQDEDLIKLKVQLSEVEKSIEDLNRPSNPILKAFSKMGTKANNVFKNVQYSLMSEEDLKKEYVIYKRIAESLTEADSKKVVSFEIFKESPEDYININSNKTSKLKKIEDDLKDGFSKTSTFLNEQIANTEKATKEISDKAQPEIEKLQQDVKASYEAAKPQLAELGSKLKSGFSLFKNKIQEVSDKYSQALKEVEAEEKAAKDNNSTPPKSTNVKTTDTKNSKGSESTDADTSKKVSTETDVKKTVKKNTSKSVVSNVSKLDDGTKENKVQPAKKKTSSTDSKSTKKDTPVKKTVRKLVSKKVEDVPSVDKAESIVSVEAPTTPVVTRRKPKM